MKTIPPKDFDALPASALVSAADIAAHAGVSLNSVWRWAKAGKLPEPSRSGWARTPCDGPQDQPAPRSRRW